MKIKFPLTGILMAAILAGGCSKPAPELFGKIELNPSIKPVTPIMKAAAVEEEQFAPGSTLGTYVWTGGLFSELHASNHLSYIGNDGKCTSNFPLQWKDQQSAHYFLSISPAPSQPVTDFQHMKFQVDASDMKKNDLMVAVNNKGLNSSATEVPLEFKHIMAQVNVMLKISSQIELTPEQVTVTAKGRTEAMIDLTSHQPKFKLQGSEGIIQLQRNSKNPSELQAVVIPQHELKEIKVHLPGEQEIEAKVPDFVPLRSGMRTSITISIGPNDAAIDNVTIGDWVPATGYEQNLEAPEALQFASVQMESKAKVLKDFGFFTDAVKNIKVSESSTTWIPEQEIILDPSKKEYEFFAYSPYMNNLNESGEHQGYFNYSLPTDQSTRTAELSAWYSKISKSDLLKQGLNLNFKKQLSFLSVSVKPVGSEVGDIEISDFKLSGVLTEAYFGVNKDKKEVETICYPESSGYTRNSVIMQMHGTKTFQCAIIPQSDVPLKINFMANGYPYEWTAAAPVTFAGNKSYTLELTMSAPTTKTGYSTQNAIISGIFKTK